MCSCVLVAAEGRTGDREHGKGRRGKGRGRAMMSEVEGEETSAVVGLSVPHTWGDDERGGRGRERARTRDESGHSGWLRQGEGKPVKGESANK